MSNIIILDEKKRILYVNTSAIMPSESDSYYGSYFELSVQERAYLFASDENWNIIFQAICDHPDWKISEFCDAF